MRKKKNENRLRNRKPFKVYKKKKSSCIILHRHFTHATRVRMAQAQVGNATGAVKYRHDDADRIYAQRAFTRVSKLTHTVA